MLPSQTFNRINDLYGYINQAIKPNGNNEIDAVKVNDVLHGLLNFILKYTVNAEEGARIHSSSDVVNIGTDTSVHIFTTAPDAINEPVYSFTRELYLANSTGVDIAFNSSFEYTDLFGVQQNSIPARTAIHIVQIKNGNWIRVNQGSSGGGTGGDLPPMGGNRGGVLVTTGTSAYWTSLVTSVRGSQFDNTRDYIPTGTNALNDFDLEIFVSEYNRFIHQDAGEWEYVTSGGNRGIRVLLPGFNSSDSNLHFTIFKKQRQ